MLASNSSLEQNNTNASINLRMEELPYSQPGVKSEQEKAATLEMHAVTFQS